MFKTCLDTFVNDFNLFWKFQIFLIFWKPFEHSTFHRTLGKKSFTKKVPQNMFKTFLDSLGTILYVFGILNSLYFFKNISKSRPSMEHWAKEFFRKNYPKTCSKHVWTLLGTILDILEKLKLFDFLRTFRRLDTPSNTGQKYFIENINPKHVQNTFGTFGNIFGYFWNFEKFSIFENISKTRPSMEHWAKLFFRKNYPKTCSKHVWTLLGTILGILDNLKLFWFFENISKTRPSMEHCGNFFFENINPKHVQNTFGHFWERFRDFCNFENLLILWKHFEVSTLHGTLGKKNLLKKLPQNMFKTRLALLGTILVIYGNLKVFWFFENISKMEHWAKKIYRKNYPKTCSKHVWTLLGNIFGYFWNFEKFSIFENISKTRPSMEHWAKQFFEGITPTLVQNAFGQFGNDFGRFCNFDIFLNFLKTFRTLDLPSNTAQKKFFQKSIQRHFQNTFGQFGYDFVRFWNFEFFKFF